MSTKLIIIDTYIYILAEFDFGSLFVDDSMIGFKMKHFYLIGISYNGFYTEGV